MFYWIKALHHRLLHRTRTVPLRFSCTVYVRFWEPSLAVFRFFYKIVYRTALKIRPFSIFYSKKNGKRLRFWNDTVYANNFITKNGWFIMTVRLTLSYQKLTVFCFLYRTVNAFLIQNGKRTVLDWDGSRFNKNDKNGQNILTVRSTVYNKIWV